MDWVRSSIGKGIGQSIRARHKRANLTAYLRANLGSFEEVPIWDRYSQLDALAKRHGRVGVCDIVMEAVTQLYFSGIVKLSRIAKAAPSKSLFLCISIQDWEHATWEGKDPERFIQPSIFISKRASEIIAPNFRLKPSLAFPIPASLDRLVLYESADPLGECPRLYLGIPFIDDARFLNLGELANPPAL